MSTLREEIRAKKAEVILAALRECNGNRRRAAAEVGVSLRTLLYALKDLREHGYQVPPRGGAAATANRP